MLNQIDPCEAATDHDYMFCFFHRSTCLSTIRPKGATTLTLLCFLNGVELIEFRFGLLSARRPGVTAFYPLFTSASRRSRSDWAPIEGELLLLRPAQAVPSTLKEDNKAIL